MAAPVQSMAGRWREDLPGTPWRWLLVPAWAAFAAGAGLRTLCYDRRWLTPIRIGAPVLSVGNLVAGGAGKTPVAIALARLLRAQGRRPAVVSRGYRGAGAANDEALLAPDLPTVCDPDRARGARAALAHGADCIVLDDGLQHRRLHRDLDVIVLDATRPWGDPAGGPGALLPLGWRREGRSALRRCQVAWISRGHLAAARAESLAATCAALGLAVVREAAPLRTLHPLAGGSAVPAPPDAVVLASGIGNPLAFERDAADLGLAVRRSLRFPDHHRYTAADVAAIAAQSSGATVVVTAKDAVKLAGLWGADLPPCLVLRAEVRLGAGAEPVLAAAVQRALGAAGAAPAPG